MTDPTLRVLLRTRYPSIEGAWDDWTDRGMDSAVDYATKRQAEGQARPMEIIEVEVIRRIVVSTSVSVVEDSGGSR